MLKTCKEAVSLEDLPAEGSERLIQQYLELLVKVGDQPLDYTLGTGPRSGHSTITVVGCQLIHRLSHYQHYLVEWNPVLTENDNIYIIYYIIYV